MRITNDTKNKKNVGADASVRPTSKARQNSGITLIALIITIIVMLILVVVTITIAINGGLFEKAGEAVGDMQNAIDSEQQLANGMLNIGGIWYDSIDDYLAGKGRNDVYAILYDDGTFAFNSTGKKIEGKTVVFKSENIGITTFNTAEEVPWSSYVSDIKTVVIEDLIKPYSTSRWFYGCSNLTEIQNIENLNTCFVTTMYCMFYGCSGLTSLDVSSFDTSNVTTMAGMFGSGANATMELTEIKGLDKFDTSKVTDMYAMFKKCTKLTSLDLSSFDTSNVTTMQSMFNGCSSLTSLDVSNFDTSNVTTMAYMFNSCSSLTNLDVTNFDTSNVTTMYCMFYNCPGLTSLDLSSFDTLNVTTMAYMFNSCSSLTNLDVTNFDTSNVTTMYGMFYNCPGLTSLDLSSFDTSNVTTMAWMFYSCTNLTEIKADSTIWKMAPTQTNMFGGGCGVSDLTYIN